MKQNIFKYIIVLCISSLIFWIVGCNGLQLESISEDVLSDAPFDSLMFSLDGIIYTLPVHFSELEANGWIPYDTDPRSGSGYRFASDILKPGGSASWELIADNHTVVVSFTNFSDEMLPLKDSHVTFVGVVYEVYIAQLIIPGNIEIGSTYEDVIEAYGVPSEWHASKNRISLLYDLNYSALQLTVDTESSQVVTMALTYLGQFTES